MDQIPFSLGFLIIALGLYVGAYVNHDRGTSDDADVVHVPVRIRPLVRSGNGPVRLSSLTAQLVSVVIAILALCVTLGLGSDQLLIAAAIAGFFFVLGVQVAVDFLRRRPG